MLTAVPPSTAGPTTPIPLFITETSTYMPTGKYDFLLLNTINVRTKQRARGGHFEQTL